MKQFNVTGMSCAACSARVEKAVSSLEGVQSCAVNLLTNSMTVEGEIESDKIIAAVERAGYGATCADNREESSTENASHQKPLKSTETAALFKRLLWSLGFLVPLMYISMGHVMWKWQLPRFMENAVLIALLQAGLALIIMIINRKFFINGVRGVLHGAPNMDTLVSLGSGASFIYSAVLTLLIIIAASANDEVKAHGYLHGLYFESAAMILALITLGKMLEAHSKGKTTDALRSLMNLAPKKAILLVDGKETEVEASGITVGDVFVVRAGESFAADGVIIEGAGAVDESALTGESIPVDKSVGDHVSAATINKSGYLVCRAEKVGSQTALAQIIKAVSDASATKAPIAKIADKVSGIFVPIVMAIALVTTAVWLMLTQDVGYSLARGISVLVISCPCALGLATPVAIMVGSGMGARGGILFKNATSLEHTGGADIVVFDKTGTITKGQPSLTDVWCADGVEKRRLLSVAYSLEKKSEHPLSRAITVACEQMGTETIECEDFKVLVGSGIEGKIDGKPAFGGNLKLISEKIDLDGSVRRQADIYAEEGKTPLLFCHDGQLLGIIAVADTVKEDSVEAISQLHKMGIKTVMLTGDNKLTAKAVARQVGIDEVISDVLPNDKESVIRSLKSKGRVIMVGDGINDAPALTSADIGIAIGAGTDIAIDAADIVLMKNSLCDVPAGIRLSRQVLKNIKENLFWAFIYNVIGIPLAAGVWIPVFGWELSPMFGAAAMSLSSFCVVMNALRLNLFDIHNPKHDRITKHKNKKENKNMTKTITIKGMMCPHCEARVKKYLEAMDGVISAEVSHEKGCAVVTTDGSVSNEALTKTVTDIDYQVISVE
ncbi:MAG: heavy metal translocating P-type ATPase [Ruminococcaceae bacterium]|nr:heavy metal translocating P-type ATPase [Oscillospiraceae bacterium]